MSKRLLDLGIATASLIMLSPLLILCGLLVKLDSRGPALFCQTRLGKDGKPFTCFKFRSMIHQADHAVHRAYVHQLIRGETPWQYDPRTDTYVLKLVHDPRITRFGRMLRQTSVDELPQLINVLRGDMSLVGPRPPLPYEVEAYQEWHLQRLAALPGITGLWQVRGRGVVSFDDMVRMDIDYIHQQSLWLDLKILFLTPLTMISGRGAG